MGAKIFQKSIGSTGKMLLTRAKYGAASWEGILQSHLGPSSLIDSVAHTDNKVFVVSSLVSHSPARIFLFRNYTFPFLLPSNHPISGGEGSSGVVSELLADSQPATNDPSSVPNVVEERTLPLGRSSVGETSRYSGSHSYKLWEAVRASTAAPSFFTEYIGDDKHIFQDGAILANNPSAIALHEARLLFPQPVRLECLVSLGCGSRISNNVESVGWAQTLDNLVYGATNTDTVHSVLEDLLPNSIYWRFNPSLSQAVGLDESRPEKFVELQQVAQEFVQANRTRLDALCDVLAPSTHKTTKISSAVEEQVHAVSDESPGFLDRLKDSFKSFPSLFSFTSQRLPAKSKL
eukprot:GILI01014383.1.p1 GENE.GILI01014383.1~~GILI01014383.1.p1  ORF type:complete len:377 (+),score=23.46 GILI01014383.1:90-1133(+)